MSSSKRIPTNTNRMEFKVDIPSYENSIPAMNKIFLLHTVKSF